MTRVHPMPFGAQLESDGGTRFRLWAPSAEAVTLRLEGAGSLRERPMARVGEGFFEARVEEAGAGTRYRFALADGAVVPDPASRFQPEGVHGASEVVAPAAFRWQDAAWQGRAWEEAVLYELHVGTFTPEGSYAGVLRRLDHLQDVGVTALELMPLAAAPGSRGWGYDGVAPFAPNAGYGRPEDLKALICEAHRRGLMVFLDVVYNHFGPEGNYLPLVAPEFFTSRHHTPWGDAIDFEGPASRVVRDFFRHNALYWLEEFRFDGLRLDAVHAIYDASKPDFLEELARAVHEGPGRERAIHLVLENDRNEARRLLRDASGQPRAYTAQWSDDAHHAFHVLLTDEREGYYEDYAEDPVGQLARCLTEGFAYQGEPSPHRGGEPRGESTQQLPPAAFVAFLQNHDQIGNRAFGDRLSAGVDPAAHRAAVTILLLAPWIPLLFMGEEWGARQPFLFFCDLEPALRDAVREGRRREFERFPAFADPAARAAIPDPTLASTFERSRLDWGALEQPEHRAWLSQFRELLRLRATEIAPRLRAAPARSGRVERPGSHSCLVSWELGDGSRLSLVARLGASGDPLPTRPDGRLLFEAAPLYGDGGGGRTLPLWAASFFLAGRGSGGPA